MANSSPLEAYLHNFRIWLQDAEFVQRPDSEIEFWDGSVGVEWHDPDTSALETCDHPISVILVPGFPYMPPIVIARDHPPLNPSWHLAPEPLQSLCLWSEEDGWQVYSTAQHLLNRIREWFVNYHTDNWPVGSRMPDLHRYLHRVGIVAIGEDWQPSEEMNGKYIVWIPTSYEGGPYFASTHSQIYSSMAQVEPEARLARPMGFAPRFYRKQVGTWFRIRDAFVPPSNLCELLDAINGSSHQTSDYAATVCRNAYGVKAKNPTLFLALGYGDTRLEERWLFLKATLPNAQGRHHKLHWSSRGFLSEVTVESFQTAPARKHDLLRRTVHLSSELTARKILIFGIGALGSSVAMLLAKAGLGTVGLVDDDIVMPGNVTRHVCGLGWTGFQKTRATEALIKTHAPDCQVVCWDTTWNRAELETRTTDFDLVIDTTANRNFSLLLNEVCVEVGRPLVHAAAYRRAAIGRVIVHRCAADPCLACYQNHDAWTENLYPHIPPNPNGAFVEDGCGSVTEEAVALDVEAVANLAARVGVNVLRSRLGDLNMAILVNEPVAEAQGILATLGTHWFSNRALSGCLVCQR